jgi:hypothetical protein
MCQLQNLRLRGGYITGPHLHWFIQPGYPSLQSLSLHSIEGLLNHELYSFLLHVSSTLTTMHIEQCVIRRREDEEYALDAAMPSMSCLRLARIEGDILSDLSIMRKPRRPKSHVNSFRGSSERDILIIRSSSSFPLILPALQMTGWDNVTLRGKTRVLDPIVKQKAIDLAAERGIEFSWLFVG